MDSRFDVFHALEPEKQKRIIDAALMEFAENGYKRASTNKIAETAQIGKGMLFYYFGSKEELFDFLCEYTIEFAKNIYLTQFNSDTDDFLEKCKKLTEVKCAAISEYPLPIAFYESFFKDDNAQYFSKHLKNINELSEQVVNSICGNIDYSLFRSDIDGESAVKYIKWLFDAYENEVTERFKRGEVNITDNIAMNTEWENFNKFCDNLRKLFYRGE